MATAITTNKKNLETFSLVWLDGSVNKSEENLDAQQRLRSSINHLKTFEDENECEQYIRSFSHLDRIVLIVSGRLGQQIIPQIHQLRQISSIYVYCLDKQRNQQWAQHFSKIRNVIVRLDELIAHIRSDQINRRYNLVDEPLIITVFKANVVQGQSTTELNRQFIHSQLLIDCLLRMESSLPTNMTELMSMCKQEYKGNKDELIILREFKQHYSENRSLWWYTRDSFVYRMLNKALRVQNIDLLFLFRFLIRDIEKQLEKNRCSSSIRVYRGQLMSNDELQLLKRSNGELISINSFLSTSLNRQRTLLFLPEETDLERVLFEIDADPRLDAVKPWANITSISYFPREEEILFMLGAIFRLVDIHRDEHRVWIIQLTLYSNSDQNLTAIFDYIKNQDGQGETNLYSFGHVLRRMGKFDEAEKYYRRHLNQLSRHDWTNIACCYYSIGSVLMEKGEYKSSLEWFKKSLKIRMQRLKSDDPILAHTHNAIATVYQHEGDSQRSLESYDMALMIFRKAFGDDHKEVAMCFHNMGIVYAKEGGYLEALHHYEKALIIRQQHLPAGHPHLAASHGNVGNVYDLLGHSDRALQHLKISLEFYKKSLPSQHPDIAKTLESIGTIYATKGEFEEALIYYEQAATIYRQTLSSTHPDLVRVERNKQRLFFQLK